VHKLIGVLVVVLAGSPAVFAQLSRPPAYQQWEGIPFGGGSFIKNFTIPTRVTGATPGASQTVGMSFASGYQVGIRLKENLGDYWGAELEYSFANQPLQFTNLTLLGAAVLETIPTVRQDRRRSFTVLHSQ
jgi:hypothetical protein